MKPSLLQDMRLILFSQTSSLKMRTPLHKVGWILGAAVTVHCSIRYFLFSPDSGSRASLPTLLHLLRLRCALVVRSERKRYFAFIIYEVIPFTVIQMVGN